MKDKYEETAIYEYVGLKPKMYSIHDMHNLEKSDIRGIILILNMMILKIHTLIKKLLDMI